MKNVKLMAHEVEAIKEWQVLILLSLYVHRNSIVQITIKVLFFLSFSLSKKILIFHH